MATQFFPTESASTATITAYTGGGFIKQLLMTRGGGVQSVTDSTLASLATDGTTNQVWGAGTGGSSNLTAGFPGGNATTVVWITNQLDAVTISGAITSNIRGLESSAMANESLGFAIYTVTNAGAATYRTNAFSTSELGTTEAARTPTVTPSFSVAQGERIALVLAWGGSSGGSTAAGFSVTGFYAGASGATGDTSITFTETITEQGVAAAVIPDIGMALTVT